MRNDNESAAHGGASVYNLLCSIMSLNHVGPNTFLLSFCPKETVYYAYLSTAKDEITPFEEYIKA